LLRFCHFAKLQQAGTLSPFEKPTAWLASMSGKSQTFVIHVAVSGIGFAASDNSEKGWLKRN